MKNPKRNKGGRPKVADKRKPLSFRLRSSVLAKAKALGRDRVERAIEEATELKMQPCGQCSVCGKTAYAMVKTLTSPTTATEETHRCNSHLME